ncbi:MAG TPA: hypothetical protein VNO50_10275 [Pyrinomonadaceae bacterium]|nr:hypothetical protein [Pyrinomonadaceae bacterium]
MKFHKRANVKPNCEEKSTLTFILARHFEAAQEIALMNAGPRGNAEDLK